MGTLYNKELKLAKKFEVGESHDLILLRKLPLNTNLNDTNLAALPS